MHKIRHATKYWGSFITDVMVVHGTGCERYKQTHLLPLSPHERYSQCVHNTKSVVNHSVLLKLHPSNHELNVHWIKLFVSSEECGSLSRNWIGCSTSLERNAVGKEMCSHSGEKVIGRVVSNLTELILETILVVMKSQNLILLLLALDSDFVCRCGHIQSKRWILRCEKIHNTTMQTSTSTLKLPQEQRDDLSILLRLPSKAILNDFAHSSIHFLSNPPKNPAATFQNVASHLPNQILSTQDVEHAMKALSNVYAAAARKGLQHEQFVATMQQCFDGGATGVDLEAPLPHHVEGIQTITQFLDVLTNQFTDNRDVLTKLFQNQNQYGNHYEELRWRLETQIASRHKKASLEPKYQFQMKTTQYELPLQFQIKSFEEMKRITTKMENALKDLKTNHARRMKKYIQ
mmetsp:Transcript_1877/g.6678  ORF Transcript_1877/g.6678 Transcript_1877/m.6678 type:complete len:404 (-) Transcript_1877:2534-3745(-)